MTVAGTMMNHGITWKCIHNTKVNPLRPNWVAGDPRELTYELTQFCCVASASRLACTQQTHCGMHTSIF